MMEDLEEDGARNGQYVERFNEKAFEAFVCPLTKQIMRDPVSIDSGHTFEREAILKWFNECRDNGRKPRCPLTQKELNSTNLYPSIALRNVIEEWIQRNEDEEIEKAHKSLVSPFSEQDVLQALGHIMHICRNNNAKKDVVRQAGLIAMITDMLKNSSRDIRVKSLETLRVLAEENDENKEAIGTGDTVRTIIKFLSHESFHERELAVSLLHELSKHELLCEKIGGVYGAILILVGMASSKSENVVAVERAESTLKNLEKSESNIKQMAENGRLHPLLTKLLEGSPETQLSMATCLGGLVLANDVKFLVAQTVGTLLVTVLRTGCMEAREAVLKALLQISSNDASTKILIEAGILPPLVQDLFDVGINHPPVKLKTIAANILVNLVTYGANLELIPVDDDNQTLLSEGIINSLLHLINNTGPAIGYQILQVLVRLTSSEKTVVEVVSAIKSSGATISLVQFIEATHTEIRVASLKLLQNISPHMDHELADALSASHLSSLLRVVSESNVVTEEQAAAVGLLAELPDRDSGLTRQLFDLNAFRILVSKLTDIRKGSIRSNRHVAPFQEGLVRVIFRITHALQVPEYLDFARENNLAELFSDLLQTSGHGKILGVSAMALENLSEESQHLTKIPEAPSAPRYCSCFYMPPPITGLCRIHHGFCSMKETFCLLNCKAVEKLVACLDHTDDEVVGAALAALCTLLNDEVDTEEGALVLHDADGIQPIFEILVGKRTRIFHQRAVWAVERILRVEDFARQAAEEQGVATTLVEAYRTGDDRTKQIAERALMHLDRIPKFSSFYSTKGG